MAINTTFKALSLAAVLLLLSACSSSSPSEDESMPPVETADEIAPAPTDEVPSPQQIEGEIAAAGPIVEDPNLAAQAPMPPVEEPAPSAPAPETDIIAADQAPLAPESNLQAPPTIEPVLEQPVVENTEPVMNSGEITQYRMKKGDTLMKVAFEQYGDLYRWREIYEANRDVIADPNAVPPGTRIKLTGAGLVHIEKNGERYKIKHGDTLGTISHDVYGTPKKWKRLWENNRQLIKNPNKIYAGFFLYYVPERRMTEDQAPAESPGAANTQAPVAPIVPAVQPTDVRAPASK